MNSSLDFATCPNCGTNDVVLASSQVRLVGGQYVGEHQDWRCTRCGHAWPDWLPGDADPASLSNLRDPRVARWSWMVITAFFAPAIAAIIGIVRQLSL